MNIVVGVVVGGIIGGSALYLLHTSNKENKPVLSKIGKVISDIGEVLEDSSVDNRNEAISQIKKSLPTGDNTINHVLNWVATGINLWKNFKKGS